MRMKHEQRSILIYTGRDYIGGTPCISIARRAAAVGTRTETDPLALLVGVSFRSRFDVRLGRVWFNDQND